MNPVQFKKTSEQKAIHTIECAFCLKNVDKLYRHIMPTGRWDLICKYCKKSEAGYDPEKR